MASISEKAILILAANLNSGPSYLITVVFRAVSISLKVKEINDYTEGFKLKHLFSDNYIGN